jgi:UDP-N-acetylmuramoylalanine--D-glutamate ligase
VTGGDAFAGHRALVVGYGISGRAAAEVLLAEGAQVRVSEARRSEDLDASGDARVELLGGGHRPEHLDGATLVLVSPGVPYGAPILTWARERGLPVWGEVELGARLCRVPYVAVTGTNGKTTTVELVARMMQAAGLAARACGNIGFPFSLATRDAFEALAVEVSSFQLAFQESLRPRVSVLLNLAPDHLDWHGSFATYGAAKSRIYAGQLPTEVHVGNRDDAAAAAVSRQAPCSVHWFGMGQPTSLGVGLIEDRLVARTAAGDLEMSLGANARQGRAFRLDAAAAAASALAFGLEPAAVSSAVQSFEPLPHRGAVVAVVGSVQFVDDSKATNPHAALASLDGRTGTVLIAGGLSKGVDLSPLAAAAPGLVAVVAIGEAAPQLAAVFEGLVPVRTASSIEEAVAAALRLSPGDGTVLLAPACASQDMFRDYRERGDRFAAAARSLTDGASIGQSGRAHA